MAQNILVLSSITHAYKAQKLLEQAWIKSSVIRTPEGLSGKGCSYSLAVRGDLDRAVTEGRQDRAAELLRENGIRILKTVAGS